MRCERRRLDPQGWDRSGSPPEVARLAAELRALVPGGASVAAAVAAIIAEVGDRGDAALRELSERFDGRSPEHLEVPRDALGAALRKTAPELRAGLELAIANVAAVARAGIDVDRTVHLPAGHEIVLRHAPVARAAIYVPGGRAPYPSTVVMGAVTARVAGVDHVAVCAPATADGLPHPAILAACALAETDAVYAVGGAQAVAALAHGTETIGAVDVIVGPGNLYVQEAKRQVSGSVGIDAFAGPSDLVVVAAPGADPRLLALDLLAQAEHGPGTLVVAASPDPAVLDEIAARIADDAPAGSGEAVAALVDTPTTETAFALAEALAPEHLELAGEEAERLAPRVRTAGCLFVGASGATAFGDYIAGANHTLPTGGAARFASGLGPATFRRRFAEVRISPQAAATLAGAAAPIARAEGFELHARSMEARVRENGAP